MKRLYRVEFRYEMYVMAEDSFQAKREARYWRSSEDPEAEVDVVQPGESVPREWFDAHPYNGDDERTVGEIVKSAK